VAKALPPEDLREWVQLRHARKKFEILACRDKERLERISKFDDDVAVKKLVSQRLKEIEGE